MCSVVVQIGRKSYAVAMLGLPTVYISDDSAYETAIVSLSATSWHGDVTPIDIVACMSYVSWYCTEYAVAV